MAEPGGFHSRAVLVTTYHYAAVGIALAYRKAEKLKGFCLKW